MGASWLVDALLQRSPSAAAVAPFGFLLAGYAHCVRANLDRWLWAQRHKTFRIARRPDAAPLSAPAPREVRPELAVEARL